MELTTNNRLTSSTWLIIFATVILTSGVVIGILYGLGLLGSTTSSHMQGIVHTEGMVHTDGMEHNPSLSNTERELEVAERGHEVMPFDLDRSTHVFETQPFGGVQMVVSDSNDPQQIKLIQIHLEQESEQFQKGDFSDPAFIHGKDMPGLAELEAGYKSIEVVYEPLLDGGKITYFAEDDELIAAIQAWFEAQLADHGAHATDN